MSELQLVPVPLPLALAQELMQALLPERVSPEPPGRALRALPERALQALEPERRQRHPLRLLTRRNRLRLHRYRGPHQMEQAQARVQPEPALARVRKPMPAQELMPALALLVLQELSQQELGHFAARVPPEEQGQV